MVLPFTETWKAEKEQVREEGRRSIWTRGGHGLQGESGVQGGHAQKLCLPRMGGKAQVRSAREGVCTGTRRGGLDTPKLTRSGG